MDQDVYERYRHLTEPAWHWRHPTENRDLEEGLVALRTERLIERIKRLEAKNARLQARVAELEAAAHNPARADPDLRVVLNAVERLRARLYPPLPEAVAATWPTPLRGQRLSPAQRRLLEDQVYAWRNPTDGSRALTYAEIAQRLDVGKARIPTLARMAERRHRAARR